MFKNKFIYTPLIAAALTFTSVGCGSLLEDAAEEAETGYTVEYVEGNSAASEGKTEFQLKVTNKSDGSTATGLTIDINAMMVMENYSHPTPKATVTESSTAGSYDCVIYYVMASEMMDGTSMGTWTLTVTIDGEATEFTPAVKMAMGDTAIAKLKSTADKIAGMTEGMAETRTYYLFTDDHMLMGSVCMFQLFLATKASMMSFPAVTASSMLTDDTGTEWNPAVELHASTNGTNWLAMSDDGLGDWSVDGLTGMENGTQGNIYIKLTIDGVQYTTDGVAAAGDGTNDYATFKITPGGSSGMSM
jgi:hypothetical protein